jgi:hypothetical protein
MRRGCLAGRPGSSIGGRAGSGRRIGSTRIRRDGPGRSSARGPRERDRRSSPVPWRNFVLAIADRVSAEASESRDHRAVSGRSSPPVWARGGSPPARLGCARDGSSRRGPGPAPPASGRPSEDRGLEVERAVAGRGQNRLCPTQPSRSRKDDVHPLTLDRERGAAVDWAAPDAGLRILAFERELAKLAGVQRPR